MLVFYSRTTERRREAVVVAFSVIAWLFGKTKKWMILFVEKATFFVGNASHLYTTRTSLVTISRGNNDIVDLVLVGRGCPSPWGA
jgi:hypothetical protein